MHVDKVNPLLAYMQANDIKPYSRTSSLLGEVGVWHSYLGDIATDKKMPTVQVLLKIEKATGGKVRAADMMDHWSGMQEQQEPELQFHGEMITES